MHIAIHFFTPLLPSRRTLLEQALSPTAKRVSVTYRDHSDQCKHFVLCEIRDLDKTARTLGILPSKLVEHLLEELVRATDNLDTVIITGGEEPVVYEPVAPPATTKYA